MSLKDIHCDIQSFVYAASYADDIKEGYSTEEEAFLAGIEYADDIMNGMRYEALLIDLIDCNATEFEDLFWNVVDMFPSAYTDSVRKFANNCGIFTSRLSAN